MTQPLNDLCADIEGFALSLKAPISTSFSSMDALDKARMLIFAHSSVLFSDLLAAYRESRLTTMGLITRALAELSSDEAILYGNSNTTVELAKKYMQQETVFQNNVNADPEKYAKVWGSSNYWYKPEYKGVKDKMLLIGEASVTQYYVECRFGHVDPSLGLSYKSSIKPNAMEMLLLWSAGHFLDTLLLIGKIDVFPAENDVYELFAQLKKISPNFSLPAIMSGMI